MFFQLSQIIQYLNIFVNIKIIFYRNKSLMRWVRLFFNYFKYPWINNFCINETEFNMNFNPHVFICTNLSAKKPRLYKEVVPEAALVEQCR